MRVIRGVLLGSLVFVAANLSAYQPAASPHTWNGPSFCTGDFSGMCDGVLLAHTDLGTFHAPSCDASTMFQWSCFYPPCAIGYMDAERLRQPVLRVVSSTSVQLEYWAENIYCNPSTDFTTDPNRPASTTYWVDIEAIDPVTLAPIALKYSIPPYYEHGSVTLTGLTPACTLYRAIYRVLGPSPKVYQVSSNIVGATGNNGTTTVSCLPDRGPSCPANGGVSPSAGKPINVGSGNMHYSETLFSVNGPGASSLPFAISYNSRDTSTGWLGTGFTYTFDQRLQTVIDATVGNSELWHGPDGLRVLLAREFHPPDPGPTFRPVYPGDLTPTMSQGATFAMTNLAGTKTEFDPTSLRWVRTTDKWGNVISSGYTGSNLTTITDALGRAWSLAYTGTKLFSITDGDGNQWRFFYDGSGRLIQIFDPLHTLSTPWRTYTWLGATTNLVTVADDSGAILEGHQYDAQGRAISSWSGDTITSPPAAPGPNARDLVTLSYDTPTQTTATSTIDTGVTQTTVYTLTTGSGRFLATSIVGRCVSCGQVEDAVAYTFDDANHPLTKIAGTGTEQVQTNYSYDANGLVLSKTEAVGKPEQRTISYAYAKADWPEFVTSVTETSAAKSGQSKISSYTWSGTNDATLTESVSGFLSSSDAGTTFTTTSTYDSRHRPTERDGPVTGQKTTWSYYSDADATLNRRGRLQTTALSTTATATLPTSYDAYDVYGTARNVTDANGVLTQRTLDARGRATSVRSVKPAGDVNEAADYVTTTVYDSRDRMTSLTLPLGNKTTYSYEDGTNRLLSTIRVDASGNQQERMIVSLNTIGGKKTESYDLCSTPAANCPAWTSSRSDAFTYSAAGRLAAITHPDSTTINYAYDTRGNLTSVQDERHFSPNTLYGYDFLNRLKTVTQKRTIVAGSDVVTQYGYDVQDNLTSVTDPNGNVTSYSFDDFGRMQSQVSPVTGTTTYSYDAAGNLRSTTDGRSATTTRTYDLANRLLTASSSKGWTELVTWTYDDATSGHYGLGRLATMSDPTGSTSFQYERRGLDRVEGRTIASNSYTSSFAYDANGNRSQITYPSSRTITFGFDFADRPVSAALGATSLVSAATYEPFGPVRTVGFGNGVTQTMAHTTRYFPISNTIGSLLTVNYAEDAAGNITQLRQTNAAWNRDFDYDDLNRLVTANSGVSLWGAGSYAYDAMGNMMSAVLGTSSTTFSYSGTTPKLTTVTGSGAASVSYDGAGNEIQDQWISPRNLVAGASTSLANTGFSYDGRGVRVYSTGTISLRVAGFWNAHAHIYSPELKPLARHDFFVAGGNPYPTGVVTEYVWLGDLPVAQLNTSGATTSVSYTSSDHLGTPILQTNAIGAVTWWAEYDPYGTIFTMRSGTAQTQLLRFPGQESTTGANTNYNIFRWYRSSWGRYTQADPIGIEGGLNVFAYAEDSPLVVFDAVGLTGEKIQVCCRPLNYGTATRVANFVWGSGQPLHCYVRMFRGDGSSSARTWSLINDNGQGVPGVNHAEDLYWQGPSFCGTPTTCPSNEMDCLNKYTQSYPRAAYPTLGVGSNSNTFARGAAKRCGLSLPPEAANVLNAPGRRLPRLP